MPRPFSGRPRHDRIRIAGHSSGTFLTGTIFAESLIISAEMFAYYTNSLKNTHTLRPADLAR